MEQQDAELIEDYLRGDPHAVATLDDWIAHAAWSYRRRLGDDWEDMLQENRLEVYRLLGANTFEGRSSLKTYIWRVVNHACLDWLRAHGKWKWRDYDDVVGELEEAGITVERKEAESRDLIRRVLATVPAECRRMWTYIVAGFSYAEMSRRLEVAEGTLRVRVLRCRRRALAVRDQLRDGEPIEEGV